MSTGVVVAGLLITLSGWHWLDPVTSLLIVAVITIGTWSVLRESVDLALDAGPGSIDLATMDAAPPGGLPGVGDVHSACVGLSRRKQP